MDARFDRQTRFAPLGPEGQTRLESARVLLVGAGALGGSLAQSLTRAGVGTLVLCDRDIVELSNLPRQVLFSEAHAAGGVPKVEAAQETLSQIGGPTRIEAHAVHVDSTNLPELSAGADLILDGTDNLATRYLINDLAVETDTPWIYGGVVGGAGLTLAVRPGRGACLRCVFPDPPPPGTLPTCDTAGVIVPAVAAVAALQAGMALRLLAEGPESELEPALIEVDVWSGFVRRIEAPADPECPCCARGERSFLLAHDRSPVVLCGRNTVQLPAPAKLPDLEALERALSGSVDRVQRVGSMLRFEAEAHVVTLFPDGRALVEGTNEPDRARALFDRYLG